MNKVYELQAWNQGAYVCGIDEVGRGCLFGPVVTAAVVLPQQTTCSFLKDSKCMTEREREKAYAWLMKHAHYAVAIGSADVIDKKNIYQATKSVMKKAFVQLIEVLPMPFESIRYLVIDAMPIDLSYPYLHKKLEIQSPIHGEQVSISVAAASIVAKVTRDRLLSRMKILFPGYGVGAHKGYATKVHTDALLLRGASLLHRKSFLVKKHVRNQYGCENQRTLF